MDGQGEWIVDKILEKKGTQYRVLFTFDDPTSDSQNLDSKYSDKDWVDLKTLEATQDGMDALLLWKEQKSKDPSRKPPKSPWWQSGVFQRNPTLTELGNEMYFGQATIDLQNLDSSQVGVGVLSSLCSLVANHKPFPPPHKEEELLTSFVTAWKNKAEWSSPDAKRCSQLLIFLILHRFPAGETADRLLRVIVQTNYGLDFTKIFKTTFIPMVEDLFESESLNAVHLGLTALKAACSQNQPGPEDRVDLFDLILKTLDSAKFRCCLKLLPQGFSQTLVSTFTAVNTLRWTEVSVELFDRIFTAIKIFADPETADEQLREDIRCCFWELANTNFPKSLITHTQLLALLDYTPFLKQTGDLTPIAKCLTELCPSNWLKPQSMFLKSEQWGTTRLWWQGQGDFHVLGDDILALLRQKSILSDVNNNIYFDQIIPFYLSPEKNILDGLGKTKAEPLAKLLNRMGRSCEPHARLLLSQIFDSRKLHMLTDFTEVARLVGAVFFTLNQEVDANHPLIKRYSQKAAEFIQFWTRDVNSLPLFDLMGCLADARALSPDYIDIIRGCLTWFFDRLHSDDACLTPGVKKALWAAARICRNYPEDLVSTSNPGGFLAGAFPQESFSVLLEYMQKGRDPPSWFEGDYLVETLGTRQHKEGLEFKRQIRVMS